MSSSPAERRQEVKVNTREEWAHSRKAGTDDGHGRFNLRPHVTCDYSVCTDVRVIKTE